MRSLAPASAALAALLLCPTALASHTIYETASGGDACGVAVVELCSASWDHFIHSEPTFYCTGSPGAYTSCDVYHQCQADASGIAMSATLSCSGVGSDTCGGTGSCSLGAAGNVDIAADTCTALQLIVTIVQAAGGGLVTGHNWVVCVNRFGPYIP